MKRIAILICIACAWAGTSRAETAVQARIGTAGFEFGFLYSDFYRVETPVVRHYSTILSEPDILVALHLARVSGTDIDVIVDLRRSGLSWYDVTRRCERTVRVYYVDLPADPGPPYGRAWGYWRKNQRGDFVMSDDEIRAYVQLGALSQHAGKSPSEVLKLRKGGRSPVEIAGVKVKADGKSAKNPAQKNKASGKPDKGKGKKR